MRVSKIRHRTGSYWASKINSVDYVIVSGSETVFESARLARPQAGTAARKRRRRERRRQDDSDGDDSVGDGGKNAKNEGETVPDAKILCCVMAMITISIFKKG